ncbi:Protein memo1 [Puccinia graminis f. sp. tritici]|uniref:Protein memo1 n=1 Tax=Puccinia graminis f. sp. tritici TaxID=56615 RepID=A0A5B0SAV8_PUCGR|nr:Protein memo1 [Puccinia graminis f. sp. tritici]
MVALHPDIRADADIRLLFPGKAASAPASASPGGYPPALAGIRADILGYPPSKWLARHILAGWKGCLPAGEACTLPAGRFLPRVLPIRRKAEPVNTTFATSLARSYLDVLSGCNLVATSSAGSYHDVLSCCDFTTSSACSYLSATSLQPPCLAFISLLPSLDFAPAHTVGMKTCGCKQLETGITDQICRPRHGTPW